MEDLAIPNTSWVIQNRIMGYPSPLTGAGWLKVIAKDTATGKKATILSLGEIQTPIQETFTSPNRLVITLPNKADILEQHDSFSDIAVVYDYTTTQAVSNDDSGESDEPEKTSTVPVSQTKGASNPNSIGTTNPQDVVLNDGSVVIDKTASLCRCQEACL